ncbi:hypothetical protein L2X99_03855 [Microbacterium sp. KUDC0406]|uniref:hypothetical protein n=1 Tax=Microbacterium sp. KUDC0406 TaxID=2909588 RepID=UPI001F413D68|nr:hypothetical protein [Microbacterium sp. KUDC0406]UJP10788.1 hypothetical protein L2X99_03855 [Microbacterium sp. KUDC0406]
MKGRIVLSVIGLLVAGALLLVMTVLGIPLEFAIAWLLILAAIVLATRQPFLDEGGAWPPEQPTPLLPGSDVSRLAWSLNPRTGVAGHVIVGRVERTLRRRLAHHGLDLDDPAQHEEIDALIGPGVRDALGRREVRRRDLERVLDAIDRISPDDIDTARQER